MIIKIEPSTNLRKSTNPNIIQSFRDGDIREENGKVVWELPPPKNRNPMHQLFADLDRDTLINDQPLAEQCKSLLQGRRLDQLDPNEFANLLLSVLPVESRHLYADKIKWLFKYWSQLFISLNSGIVGGALSNPEESVFGLGNSSVSKHNIHFRNGEIYITSQLTTMHYAAVNSSSNFLPGTIKVKADVTERGIFVREFEVSNNWLQLCFYKNKLPINEKIASDLIVIEELSGYIAAVEAGISEADFANFKNPQLCFEEYRESLLELKNLLKDQRTLEQGLLPLRWYLAKRFQRIINTDIVYPHAPLHPLNLICISLAKKLSPIFKISYLQLLIPTVEVLENPITGTSFDEPLQLHEFVLSQDNKRFIEIKPCLDCAVEDGDLKHTSLYNDKQQGLSKEEAERVRLHSAQTRAFYQQITAIVLRKNESTTIGAIIQTLIQGLRRGGAHGNNGGSELNSGAAANEAIFRFSVFLELLDEPTKTMLMACHERGNPDKKFGDLWGRLSRPADSNYQSVIFCVELISSAAERILDNNPQLFNIQLKGGMTAVAIDRQIAARDAAQKSLEQGLNGNNYRVTASYGDEKTQRLSFIENFCVTMPWRTVTRIIGEQALREFFSNYRSLANIFRRLSNEECMGIISHLKTTYGQEFLYRVANGADSLGYILASLNPEISLAFVTSFIRNLKAIAPSGEMVAYLINRLPEEHRILLLEAFNPELFDITQNGQGLGYILAALPSSAWQKLIGFIGISRVTATFAKSQSAVEMFAPLSPDNFPTFLELSTRLLNAKISFENPNYLRDLLVGLPIGHMEALVKALIEQYTGAYIRRVVLGIDRLIAILESLTDKKKIALLKLLQPFLKHFLPTAVSISNFLAKFVSIQADLLPVITPDLISGVITNSTDLICILANIYSDHKITFLKLLKPEAINNALSDNKSIRVILDYLKPDEYISCLDILTKPRVKKFIQKYPESLGRLIAAFTVEHCANLLNWLDKDLLNISLLKLIEILEMLPEQDRLQFIKLVADKNLLDLPKIFANLDSDLIVNLINVFATKDRKEFLLLLQNFTGNNYTKIPGWNNLAVLTGVLGKLSPPELRLTYLCDLVGIEAISGLIKNSQDICDLLSAFLVDSWLALLQWLGQAVVQRCCPTFTTLQTVFNHIFQVGNKSDPALVQLLGFVMPNLNTLFTYLRSTPDDNARLGFIKLIQKTYLDTLITNSAQLTYFFTNIPISSKDTLCDGLIPQAIIKLLAASKPEDVDNISLALINIFRNIDMHHQGNLLGKFTVLQRQQLFSSLKTFKEGLNTFAQKETFLTYFPIDWLYSKLFTSLADTHSILSNCPSSAASYLDIAKLAKLISNKNDIDYLKTHMTYFRAHFRRIITELPSKISEKLLVNARISQSIRNRMLEVTTEFKNETYSYIGALKFWGTISPQQKYVASLIQYINEGFILAIQDQVFCQRQLNTSQEGPERWPFHLCLQGVENILKQAIEQQIGDYLNSPNNSSYPRIK